MSSTIRAACLVLVAVIIAVIAGCSGFEPKTGTKVTLAFQQGTDVPREKLAELCGYLVDRSKGVAAVDKPRVDSVSDDSLVLLLPGKRVSRRNVNRLIEKTSIDFYHLSAVATKKHPGRPWKLVSASGENNAYIFADHNSHRINSSSQQHELMEQIVKVGEKPILTGEDILRNATYNQTKSGWVVLVSFNERGSETFYEFTRDNRGEYLAVFYNGALVSAAQVDGPIKGGRAFLTGFRTMAQAREAAFEINTGVIPVNVSVKSVRYY
ncbi:MAG: hypothetical protein ABFD54_13670 [Armatimonadota bacterium]|nr:hypothetical protein [bacterium]